MKRLVLAVLLVCALVPSTFAGDIPSVGTPMPPPTGPNGMTSTFAPGDIPTDGIADQLSNEALSALLTALASVMS